MRYSIEREVVDTTRKINILSCQLFLKTVEGSVNESKTLNFSTNQTEDVINPPFYLANQISPIQKQSENKREILIKDNSIRETPSKKNYDSSEEISLPQKPKFTTESSKIDTLQDQPMRSGPKRTEGNPPLNIYKPLDYNSDHVFSVSSETGKGGKLTGSFASPRSNQTTSPRNGNTGLSYPPPTNSQPIPKERETAKEEHFTDYSVRAKDVMRLIENFMVTEINTLKKDNLPGEYYVLRKNFDILYRLFKVHEIYWFLSSRKEKMLKVSSWTTL